MFEVVDAYVLMVYSSGRMSDITQSFAQGFGQSLLRAVTV